jgi:hypothetical protein
MLFLHLPLLEGICRHGLTCWDQLCYRSLRLVSILHPFITEEARDTQRGATISDEQAVVSKLHETVGHATFGLVSRRERVLGYGQ